MAEPATLTRLMAEAGRFSVEFDPFLANHLPMALVILDRLGASEQRLEAFFETYRDTSVLRPAPAGSGRIERGNWQAHLGDRSYEGDYRAFFAAEVARDGVDAVLGTYLEDLVPGIAASALHALMRLAYARLRDDPAETATALGYWATTYLPLRFAGRSEAVTDQPVEVLHRMRQMADLREVEVESDLLWHWMRAVARKAAFPPVVDWLATGPSTLARTAGASLAFYAGTMSFEALHALTGTHWIRIIGQGWPDQGMALGYFWQAISSVYPKVGMPELPDAATLDGWRALEAPPWPEIKARACLSDDEHDISLVYSAFEEERHWRDPLYRVVAARRVGLLP